MYSLDFRKLALRKVSEIGVFKTSKLLHIHRSTLWRWRTNTNSRPKKSRINRLFSKVCDFITDFIRNNPFIPLYKLRRELEIIQKISKVTLSKYVNKLGFSRKRAKKRGRCKNNALEMLTKNFIDKFDQSKTANTKFVCIDECGFSENLRPLYGYSKKGEPLTIHTSGGWTHYSLLMAVFQCGKLNFSIKKGSINKSNFQTFINRLQIDDSYSIVMDNASIHKKLTLDCNPNIIYTPPYSPQFQPIELCFANIKRRFRNKFVENNVSEAIKESVFELSPEIIKSCFSHAFEKEIPLARTMTKI